MTHEARPASFTIAAQAKGQGIDLDDLAAALVKLAGRAS